MPPLPALSAPCLEEATVKKRTSDRRLAGVSLLVLFAGAVRAEVVVRGGPSLSGAVEVPASLGKTAGGNLFHSFDVFNVHAGESVRFTGPDAIKNVVSRVTGSTSTLIDGPLSVAIPGANFYFINPNGIVFGSSGSVQATGSVYFSTAGVVRFRDGAYYADPSETSTLSSSPPSAFGFVDQKGAPIVVRSTTFGVPPFPVPVPTGETFGLVAHGVAVQRIPDNKSFIVAPGANVSLVSVSPRSIGDVLFRADGTLDINGLAPGTLDLQGSGNPGWIDVGKDVDVIDGQGVYNVVQHGSTTPPAGGVVDPPPPPSQRPPSAAPPAEAKRTFAGSPDTRPGSPLLPDAPLGGTGAVLPTCEAARSGLSSIVQINRGGLPADPDGYLPSRGAAPVRAAAPRPGATPATAGRQPYDSFVIAKLDCTG